MRILALRNTTAIQEKLAALLPAREAVHADRGWKWLTPDLPDWESLRIGLLFATMAAAVALTIKASRDFYKGQSDKGGLALMRAAILAGSTLPLWYFTQPSAK